MFSPTRHLTHSARLLSLALSAAALAGGVPAAAHADGHQAQPLVIRGDDTLADGACDATGVCHPQISDGQFRGTLGSGAYAGALKLDVAEAFPNGEGGLCAPIRGHITFGLGTPDRLAVTFAGDSCQDGHGPVTQASFTGVAAFKVVHGTGRYADATGSGLLTSSEGADDHERLTLIGRIG